MSSGKSTEELRTIPCRRSTANPCASRCNSWPTPINPPWIGGAGGALFTRWSNAVCIPKIQGGFELKCRKDVLNAFRCHSSQRVVRQLASIERYGDANVNPIWNRHRRIDDNV